MDLQNEKCVMVIDENLPLGIIANTAAIMGITLGNVIGKEDKWHEQKIEGISRNFPPLIRSDAGGWVNTSGSPKRI